MKAYIQQCGVIRGGYVRHFAPRPGPGRSSDYGGALLGRVLALTDATHTRGSRLL